jgi:hypothetical protein
MGYPIHRVIAYPVWEKSLAPADIEQGAITRLSAFGLVCVTTVKKQRHRAVEAAVG